MARAQTTGGPLVGSTIIGPEIRVSGRVTGEEDLHVQGRIDGSIVLTETLFVAPGGIVAAEVDALNVVVSGVVVGNVTARDCVTLHAGAKLVGDISAPRLVIADGAAFKGAVHMGTEADDAPSRSAARSRPAPPKQKTPPPRATSTPVAPRRAPPPPPRAATPPAVDDEPTVIVRHAELAEPEAASSDAPPADTARFRGVAAVRNPASVRDADKTKLPARARIPKPGKRRVNRR
jgi:cytoskeletal protein CcmA (bactofilin family)